MVLGIALVTLGIGVGLYLVFNTGQPGADFGWEHPAFADPGSPPHGDAPVLECWDCHGSHPDTTGVPPADGMSCFDCHEVL